jgi:hypothetical protein
MNTTTRSPLGGFEERLLHELREIVAQRSQPAPGQRTPFLRARTTMPRRGLRLGATIGAVTVAVVAVVLVLGTNGGGPPKALAGWSAQPTAPAIGQLQAAESACQQRSAGLGSLTPILVDVRGPFSLLIYAQSGSTTTCLTGLPVGGTFVSNPDTHAPSVATGTIDPTQDLNMSILTGGYLHIVVGPVGVGVTGVSFGLDDGSSVEATVANGWLAAWWPGIQGAHGTQGAKSATITTESGTTTQPMNIGGVTYVGSPPPIPGTPSPAGGTSPTGSSGTTASGASGASGTTPAN